MSWMHTILGVILAIPLVMGIRWLFEDSGMLDEKQKIWITALVVMILITLVAVAMNEGTAGTETAVPEEPPRIVICISQGKMRIIRLDENEKETELIETEIDQE